MYFLDWNWFEFSRFINHTPAQQSWLVGAILDSPCPSFSPSVRPSVHLKATWFSEHNFSFLWNFNFKFHKHIPYDTMWRSVDFHVESQIFHFYPGLRCLPLSLCPSIHPSVNHEFVRAITHHPFQLGSPNLDQRCKMPWLRSLLFCGRIDRDLQRQIELQSQNLPNFELVHAITHHQMKLQFPNLGQKCILALFRSLPILGLIESNLQFNS